MTFPLGGPATTLTVGKTKETFAYEMVGDAAMEVPRGLGPHVAGSLRKDGRDRQRAYPAAVDLLRALAQVDRGGVRAFFIAAHDQRKGFRKSEVTWKDMT
jgi:hypothetical protein